MPIHGISPEGSRARAFLSRRQYGNRGEKGEGEDHNEERQLDHVDSLLPDFVVIGSGRRGQPASAKHPLERPAGTVDSSLHRAHRLAQALRDLVVTQFVQDTEAQHRPIIRPHPFHAVTHDPVDLIRGENLFRRVNVSRRPLEFVEWRIGLSQVDRLSPALPEKSDALIQCNAGQPRRDGGVLPIIREMLIRLPQGDLNDILDISPIPDNAPATQRNRGACA